MALLPCIRGLLALLLCVELLCPTVAIANVLNVRASNKAHHVYITAADRVPLISKKTISCHAAVNMKTNRRSARLKTCASTTRTKRPVGAAYRRGLKPLDASVLTPWNYDTSDVCPDDAVTCVVQGESATIRVIEGYPGNPPGAETWNILTFGRQLPTYITSSFDPATSNPLNEETTQTLTAAPNAVIGPFLDEIGDYQSGAPEMGVDGEYFEEQDKVYVLCSFALQTCPILNVVDEKNADAIVSDNAEHATVVGAQQGLALAASAGPNGTGTFTISAPQWSLPYYTFPVSQYSYNVTGSGSSPVQPAALQQSALTFYDTFSGSWGNGGTGSDQNIYASAVLTSTDGSETSIATSQAEFLVQRPSLQDRSFSYGSTQVGPYDPNSDLDFLSFGTIEDPYLNQTAGIYYDFTATFPTNFDGEIGVTQLVNGSIQTTPGSSPTGDPLALGNTGGNYEADGCLQYAPAVAGLTTATFNLSTTVPAFDAPADPLTSNNYSSVTDAEAFDTYYMYKSSLPNSIWVTLYRVQWSWGGTAGFEPPWRLESAPQPGYFGFLALEQPQWGGVNLYQGTLCPAVL